MNRVLAAVLLGAAVCSTIPGACAAAESTRALDTAAIMLKNEGGI